MAFPLRFEGQEDHVGLLLFKAFDLELLVLVLARERDRSRGLYLVVVHIKACNHLFGGRFLVESGEIDDICLSFGPCDLGAIAIQGKYVDVGHGGAG